MGRSCSICTHPKRALLDARLSNGEAVKPLAVEFSVVHTSLRRHWMTCVGLPSPAQTRKQQSKATVAFASLPSQDELCFAYNDLRGRIDAVVHEAQSKGSLAIALQGLGHLRQTLDSLGKLAAPVLLPPQVTVNVDVSINTAVQKIIAALGQNPTAEQLSRLEAMIDG